GNYVTTTRWNRELSIAGWRYAAKPELAAPAQMLASDNAFLWVVAREAERAQTKNCTGIITLAGDPQNRVAGLACHCSRSFENSGSDAKDLQRGGDRRQGVGRIANPWRARRRSRRRS